MIVSLFTHILRKRLCNADPPPQHQDHVQWSNVVSTLHFFLALLFAMQELIVSLAGRSKLRSRWTSLPVVMFRLTLQNIDSFKGEAHTFVPPLFNSMEGNEEHSLLYAKLLHGRHERLPWMPLWHCRSFRIQTYPDGGGAFQQQQSVGASLA